MRFQRRFTSLGIWLIWLGIVIFLRFPTFSQSVINWDESIYILMADSMVDGHIPYTVIWELKPPGLYALFALAQLSFGHSIVTFRLLSCLAVATSCHFLYLWGRQSHIQIGVLAAFFYAFFSLKNDGLAANAEIFFTPLVILAFYLAWPHVVSLSWGNGQIFLLIGLVMGLALQIKPIVLFDLAALITLFALQFYRTKLSSRQIITFSSLLGIGLIVPSSLVWLYFWYRGHWADYYYANVTATWMRGQLNTLAIEWSLRVLMNQLKTNFILDIAFFLLLLFRYKISFLPANFRWLMLWVICASLGVAFTKSFYPHYFLQLLPPLCLLASAMIYQIVYNKKQYFVATLVILLTLAQPIFDPLALTPLALAMRLLLPLLLLGGYVLSYQWPISPMWRLHGTWGLLILLSMGQPLLEPTQGSFHAMVSPALPDTSQQIAIYLRPRLSLSDTIYVVNYQPIIYYLLDISPPTKYAFPPFLTTPEFARLAGVNPVIELAHIMSQKPKYLIMITPEQHTPFYEQVTHELEQNYQLETIISEVKLYKRQLGVVDNSSISCLDWQ